MDALAIGRSQAMRVTGPLPSEVKGVLAQRLFVEKASLPSPLLNQMKRLAAFQNPEFYKKQKMRLSTAMTPRVVACRRSFPRSLPSREAARLKWRSSSATTA